jgi:phosphatidylserine decarboxylase
MIAKEGCVFVVIPVIAGILFLLFFKSVFLVFFGWLFILTGIFCAFFFRDPARKIPAGENLVLSPCDGTVMETSVEKDVKVIRVFLSVFNVHIQRSPVSGLLKNVEYRPGRFLPANKPEAHMVNEQNIFTIQTKKGSLIIVKQIAGILARRVVAWSKAGDSLQAGDKIGLIKFSSQVDLHLPLSAGIKVKPGDKINGRETIIGEFE